VLTPTGRRGRHARLPIPDATIPDPEAASPANPLVRAMYDVLADVGVYSTQTYYIKRVIGLPGDHVVCCVNGKLTVNGVPLDETSYLFPGARPSVQPFRVIVPPGRLWVMGDNRAISDDSRGRKSAGFPAMGTVPENEVAGRAFLIVWPPSQLGDLPIPATFQQAALHAGPPGPRCSRWPARRWRPSPRPLPRPVRRCSPASRSSHGGCGGCAGDPLPRRAGSQVRGS